MTAPKRIALVCNSSWAMVNFRLSVMRALKAEGHELTVVAPDDGARRVLEAEGIGYEEWKVGARGTNPLREASALLGLATSLGRLRPDLSLCYTIKPAIYGSFIGGLLRIPTYAIVTGLGYAFLAQGPRSGLARLLYRLALRFSSQVWFLNEDDRRLFRDRGLIRDGEGFVLPGEGVDTERFALAPPRAEDGRVRFLMISRLLVDKGVGEYLAAARLVRAERPEAVFALAGDFGDGGPGSIPAGDIESLQRAGVLEYLGRLEDIRPAIAQADFVVLPSYREGIPRSLLEAASMGRPLVATDVPGCREVALEGKNAFLATARDVESLRTALLRALDLDRREAQAMGLRGRDIVLSKFGDAAVVAVYKKRVEGA